MDSASLRDLFTKPYGAPAPTESQWRVLYADDVHFQHYTPAPPLPTPADALAAVRAYRPQPSGPGHAPGRHGCPTPAAACPACGRQPATINFVKERMLMDADTILNSIEAAAYAKDLDGNYTYANATVERIFGADLAGIIGKDDSHFFDLEKSNALRENDAEVIANGTSVAREERDIIKESGEERIYFTIKSPLRDASGTIVGMCGLSIDITNRG
jgi:PAS domain S-box-containing protein